MSFSTLKISNLSEIFLEIIKYTRVDHFYRIIKNSRFKLTDNDFTAINRIFGAVVTDVLKMEDIHFNETQNPPFNYFEFYEEYLSVIKRIDMLIEVADIHTDQSDMTQLRIINDNLIISSDDGTIKLIKITDSLLNNSPYFYTYNGHSGGVWALDTDGKFVVSGSTDKTYRILKIEEDKITEICTRKVHVSTVRVIKMVDYRGEQFNKEDFNDVFAVSGSRDNSIVLFDKFGFPLKKFTGHTESVRTLDVSNSLLLSGSYDGTVKLWSLTKKCFIKEVHRHRNRVYVVKISKKFIISGGMQGEVQFSRMGGGNPTVLSFTDCTLIPWLEILNNNFICVSLNGVIIKYDLINNRQMYKKSYNVVVKYCKIHKGLILLGTQTGCIILDIFDGKEIKRIKEGYQVSKVDYSDDKIVVGYIDEVGSYKVVINTINNK
ncbi:hypothetical protein NUSPORA_00378 [Nucleospora cyclopteri]